MEESQISSDDFYLLSFASGLSGQNTRVARPLELSSRVLRRFFPQEEFCGEPLKSSALLCWHREQYPKLHMFDKILKNKTRSQELLDQNISHRHGLIAWLPDGREVRYDLPTTSFVTVQEFVQLKCFRADDNRVKFSAGNFSKNGAWRSRPQAEIFSAHRNPFGHRRF